MKLSQGAFFTIDLVVNHRSETRFHCLRDIEAEQREQAIGRQH